MVIPNGFDLLEWIADATKNIRIEIKKITIRN